MAGLAVVGSTLAVVYVNYRFGQIAKVKVPGLVHHGVDSAGPVPLEQRSAMTILLVGNNTRTGLDPSEASQFGTSSEVGGARSDVTMLLHLDPVKGASILSIPRDLFVPLPPHSMVGSVGKIDAALNDGPEQLVETITNDLGIPIDHYVSINFDGFQHVIDALGGINLSFPTPLRDTYSGLQIDLPGCRHLNGSTALAVVRARHLQYLAAGRWLNDPESDLSRIRRDHEFLTVFAKTVKAKDLTNPLQANAVLGNLVHQVTIDSGLSIGAMLGLLRQYHGLNPDTVPELTLPVTLVPAGNYRYDGGSYGSVVFPSQPADEQVIDSFLGRPTPAAPTGPSAPVEIVDRSGAGAGRRVAAGLAAAGFTIAAQRSSYAAAVPSETVVRYQPGDQAAAQQVLTSLGGAALLYADVQAPAGTVVVDVGSLTTVLAAGPPTAGPTAAPPATTDPAGGSSPTAGAGSPPTTIAVPTPGGEPVSPSVTPAASFDPTGC